MSQLVHNTPTPQMLTTLRLTPTEPLAKITPAPNVIQEYNMEFGSDVKQEFGIGTDINTALTSTDQYITPEEISPKIRVTPTSKLLASPNPIDPKRKFLCPHEDCNKSYGKSSHLRSHLTWHTGIKPYVCSEPNCGKGFTRSDELNRHIRTHTGEKPFECVQCTKKFARSDHLTKHLATHERQIKTPTKRQTSIPNSSTPFECVQCSKKFSRSDHLTKHLATHERHIKAPTKRQSSSQSSSNKSEKTAKPNEDSQPYMHFMEALVDHQTDNIKFDPCLGMNTTVPLNGTIDTKPNPQVPDEVRTEQFSFDHSSAITATPLSEISESKFTPQTEILPTDIKIENTDIREPDYNAATPVLNPEPVTNMRYNVSDEVKNEPVDDEDPTLLLRLPEADGPNSYGMPQFIQHNEDRPYHCRECLKRFKRQDDLNRHVRTHTGEKPYACTYEDCKRRFMRSDHLRKHQQTHLKDR